MELGGKLFSHREHWPVPKEVSWGELCGFSTGEGAKAGCWSAGHTASLSSERATAPGRPLLLRVSCCAPRPPISSHRLPQSKPRAASALPATCPSLRRPSSHPRPVPRPLTFPISAINGTLITPGRRCVMACSGLMRAENQTRMGNEGWGLLGG